MSQPTCRKPFPAARLEADGDFFFEDDPGCVRDHGESRTEITLTAITLTEPLEIILVAQSHSAGDGGQVPDQISRTTRTIASMTCCKAPADLAVH